MNLFTGAGHWSVMLSCYVRSRFESDLISSHSLAKILYVFFFPMHATHPSYFSVLDLIFLIILSEPVTVASRSKT
jgi:hypothetical protein